MGDGDNPWILNNLSDHNPNQCLSE